MKRFLISIQLLLVSTCRKLSLHPCKQINTTKLNNTVSFWTL